MFACVWRQTKKKFCQIGRTKKPRKRKKNVKEYQCFRFPVFASYRFLSLSYRKFFYTILSFATFWNNLCTATRRHRPEPIVCVSVCVSHLDLIWKGTSFLAGTFYHTWYVHKRVIGNSWNPIKPSVSSWDFEIWKEKDLCSLTLFQHCIAWNYRKTY